ncbi:MAG: acetylornithine deacetylase, partial [Pedobacter sp.]
MIEQLQKDSFELLKKLISIQSFSKEEDKTAEAIEQFLQERGIKTNRKLNNIWAYNKYFDAAKPTLLLNSHHDTVKPNSGYTRDPYDAAVEGDKLF